MTSKSTRVLTKKKGPAGKRKKNSRCAKNRKHAPVPATAIKLASLFCDPRLFLLTAASIGLRKRHFLYLVFLQSWISIRYVGLSGFASTDSCKGGVDDHLESGMRPSLFE
jgi:hypothetical protein